MEQTLLKDLYYKMLRIRRIEEAVADRYSEKEMRCPVHLSIGQEAVPTAICAQLTKEDRVYSTHRCHAHYLAKNGSVNKMIAELYGKSTGCVKGKGGSMHLVDIDEGMMGSSALVGGTIPLAVGSALAISFSGKPHVSIAFFGDGGTEEGIFYESMNFAMLKKLPVIFAVENNLYATYSHQRARQALTQIWKRGEAFGIPSAEVDGNDVKASYAAAKTAIERARSGGGPTLLEFHTYRWRDHVGPSFDIPIGYRTQEELDSWMAKCPLKKIEAEFEKSGNLAALDKEGLERKVKAEVDEAFEFAKASPLPSLNEMYTDVYAQH